MSELVSWQPSAAMPLLKERARLIARIRRFFQERGVLEVETPIMSHATVTDPHIASIPVAYQEIGSTHASTLYLQTSPEYAMKRLLAAGSGAIFQITKSFRQGERGRLHNPEFTMLEWYRPGFDHHALMDEMEALLCEVLAVTKVKRMTVYEVFQHYLKINPHHATLTELIDCAKQHDIHYDTHAEQKNVWLDLLFSHAIEPHLGHDGPVFIYDYPVSQAALAKIRDEVVPVASRFEVYVKGIELANGFHELQDPNEQRQRFLGDLAFRSENSMDIVPMDERLLSALESGLPDCAGVALGLDRLVMLALGEQSIAAVMGFDFARA